MSIAFESLLARELSSQLTPRALHRSSPPQLIDTYQSPILLNHDVPVETDNYAGVLLRAIRMCACRLVLRILTSRKQSMHPTLGS